MGIEQLLLERIKQLNEAQKQQALSLLDNLLAAKIPVGGKALPPFTPGAIKIGIAEGKYTTSDDFDEPIDYLFDF